MKNEGIKRPVDTSKKIAVNVLFTISVLIILSGVFFVAYSIIFDVWLNVLSTKVHGVIFGLVVAFLGIRYFLSVRRLKPEVYKTEAKFSWSNIVKRKAKS